MYGFLRRCSGVGLVFGITLMQCQTSPEASVPSIKSKVNVVLIDIVVDNKKDEPVTGLTIDRFPLSALHARKAYRFPGVFFSRPRPAIN